MPENRVLKKIVSQIKGRTWAEGAREWGAENRVAKNRVPENRVLKKIE